MTSQSSGKLTTTESTTPQPQAADGFEVEEVDTSTVEQEPKKSAKAPKLPKMIGTMQQGKWGKSQTTIWRCVKCGATTFREDDAYAHKCAVLRKADDQQGDQT